MVSKSNLSLTESFFLSKGWNIQLFQQEMEKAILNQESGILNAPTGSGKTFAVLIPFLSRFAGKDKEFNQVKLIWITPVKALTRDIMAAAAEAVAFFDLHWKADIRTGDTSVIERASQKKSSPQILITTPESLQILISNRDHLDFFAGLDMLVVDEWHELLGSKRAVQMELAIAYLHSFRPALMLWGISATIGNMEVALDVLLYNWKLNQTPRLIRSDIRKEIFVETILPIDVLKFPWYGNLGIYHLESLAEIIDSHSSTLIFTNTRAQCEIWYRALIEYKKDWSGKVAMHHGSMGREMRNWVEEALHIGVLSGVIATSSLDLGVDFRPVDAVVQIGSPKGVARFMQRAGRSGHRPGEISKIYFLPTHALEITEGIAIRYAIYSSALESRLPYIRSFDVLHQFLMTLAVGEGFDSPKIFEIVKNTFSFSSVSEEEWNWVINFLVYGGSMESYDDFQKVGRDHTGIYRAMNKGVVNRHRVSIGTIVGDSSIQIKFLSGKNIGTVEEWFINQLNIGDTFWFAGRLLELVNIKGNIAFVKKGTKGKGLIPSWMGGRMPLSSELAYQIRQVITRYKQDTLTPDEQKSVSQIFSLQETISHLPESDELLIEKYESKDGFHLLVYPIEGRLVHEGLAILLAYRISKIHPVSISIAVNDYGLELLSDLPFDIDESDFIKLLYTENLHTDIMSGINATDLAKRRFRDISIIAGMVFRGMPGKFKKDKHLHMGSGLLFNVFRDYDPDNLLYRQAYEETMTFQFEENRLRDTLSRMAAQKIMVIEPAHFSIFAFPVVADRLRARLSSEKALDRLAKMKLQLLK